MKYLKNTILILFIVIINPNCTSQTQKTHKISLDGTWDIIFDAKNQGVAKDWYINDVFEQLNYEKIKVPSCWEETKKNYEGAGIYRTKFTIPKYWNKKIIQLNFEASNYKTEVWLNDQVVGFHEGGYTPFSFRVDKLIKVGEENTLVLDYLNVYEQKN